MTDAAPTINSSSRLARIERWVPGVRTVRTYKTAWLPRDLVSGAVLCALLVPQGMAYAELAGLPAITGLYTTVVCLLAYAAFGPSPFLILGPDSSLGPMIAAAILPLAAGSTDYAIALAGMLALMVSVICIGAGLAQMGFVADLISKPVRIGYLAGLALTIFVGQLPKLFGYSVDADGLVQEFVVFLQNLEQTNPWTLAVGLLSLISHPGLEALGAARAGGAGGGGRLHWDNQLLRPGSQRRRHGGRAAAGISLAFLSESRSLRSALAPRNSFWHLPGSCRRYHFHLSRVCSAQRI